MDVTLDRTLTLPTSAPRRRDLGRLVRGGLRWLNAQVRLRRCRLGRRVTVWGNPHVTATGEIALGDRVTVHSFLSRVQLSAGPGARLTVGDDTYINNGSVLSARRSVTVGARCQVATGVILMDADFHAVGDLDAPGKAAPIVIEDDVWLATRAVVLKGVTVGRGAVVAAGAVVTKDVPPYTLVAGVPARPIRSLR
ncbi:DapH/DapD/GlmU-related protein [Rubrivirga sp. SAORIC476]|uniref:acyltransferase n=1 Tax=Rubrivirga sp. SAORIC476 TaxID=1961794 RepID=UPI000BA97C3C|nr:acyltransferase [Rubrivirga sp. SAORIC476]